MSLFTSKMKILLTGATGFLGQHIIARLTKENVRLVALVRPTSEVSHLKSDRLQFIFGDLRDENCIQEALKGVDVVIHAATSKGGGWDDYHEVNIKSTELLLKHARERKLRRFIFISSVIVYNHTNAKGETTFTEADQYEEKQFTFYSKSKIAAEQLVQQHHQEFGIPTVILRPAGLFGKGGLLYPARLGFAAGGNRYLTVGNGKTPLPLTHVDSLSESIWACIKNEKSVGQRYNITEDEPITQLEYLKLVKEHFNPKLSITRVPHSFFKAGEFWGGKVFGLLGRRPPIRPLYLKFCTTSFCYSNERAKNELEWTPKNNVRAAVKEMMLWHKAKRTPKRSVVIPRGRLNTDRVLNIGVVGCGMFSETHLSILRKLNHARVVSICDPNPEARKQMAEKFGISKTYGELKEMLAQEKIDVVHITTPAQTHALLSIEAMKNGCHVLVEKPMALNAKEAQEMIAVAKENNVKLCVDHSHLYRGAMLEARKILARGSIGKIAYVDCWFGTSYSSNSNSRYLDYEARNHWVYQLPGELYQNMISHPISIVMDFMDDHFSLQSSSGYMKIVPHMKSDELRVLFKSGETLGTLCLSMAVSPRYDYVNIYGTKGTLKVDIMNGQVIEEKVMPFLPKVIGRNLMNIKISSNIFFSVFKNFFDIARGRYSQFDGVENLIRLFYKSILNDEPVPVTPEEGLQSMQIMDTIWEQIKKENESFPRNGKRRAIEQEVAFVE